MLTAFPLTKFLSGHRRAQRKEGRSSGGELCNRRRPLGGVRREASMTEVTGLNKFGKMNTA